MTSMGPQEAREALDAVTQARADVAQEVGLPRLYWVVMGTAWVVLGFIGDVGPGWLTTVATIAFSMGHATVATRLLSGRYRTSQLQVGAELAGERIPLAVTLMLVSMAAVTILLAFALHADGTSHAGSFSGLFVGSVVAFGGPDILRVFRRLVRG